MAQGWNKKSLRLKEKHGWKSKPGHAICVIDRGAIRPSGRRSPVAPAVLPPVSFEPRSITEPRPSGSCLHLPSRLEDLVAGELYSGLTCGDCVALHLDQIARLVNEHPLLLRMD
jgi:hypothetical protein